MKIKEILTMYGHSRGLNIDLPLPGEPEDLTDTTNILIDEGGGYWELIYQPPTLMQVLDKERKHKRIQAVYKMFKELYGGKKK